MVFAARSPHAGIQRSSRRGVGLLLSLLLVLAALALGGGPAGAAPSPGGSGRCAAPETNAPSRAVVHRHVVSGLVRPAAVACSGHLSAADGGAAGGTGDTATGTPPLINHGGPVMGTPSVNNEVVMVPIFWAPPGYSFDAGYQNVITAYLHDIAAASNAHSNVFATTTEYSGSNGQVHYHLVVGNGSTDGDAFPTSGCTVNSGNVYADGSGYTECLDDAQVQAEVAKIVSRVGGTTDYGHIYILFTPKHVESCFYAGNPSNQQCTLNSTSSAAYCAYHSSYNGTAIYANMPFPIYESPTGSTCGSDANYSTIEAPNGDLDGDTEVSPLSHELAEAMTDPNGNAWYDSTGNENGDECAYTYGAYSGPAGAYYNQTIMGDHYLTQEEFSNNAYNSGGGGCIQGLPLTPPSVSGLSPAYGPASGGTTVTISGSNLGYASAVSFGGTPASSFTVVSNTQISAVAPAHGAGGVDVTVANPDGSNAASSSDKFTYYAAPTVTGVSPSSGPTAGGTNVSIYGTNLAGATAVSFGSTSAASFTVLSNTQLSAVAPASAAAQSVDISVTAPGGTSTTGSSDQYQYLAGPAVSSVSPSSGPLAGGQSVTISGTGLTGATGVSIGGAPAQFTIVSDAEISATTPAGAPGTYDVLVTTTDGTSSAVPGDQYTYMAQPAVTGVSPSTGPAAGGQQITLTGTDFTGATQVLFGGTAASSFAVVDAQHITASAPAGSPGTVDITVTTGGGTSASSSSDEYTYLARPAVTGVAPRSGPTGGRTRVTIDGRGFTGATKVTFGSVAARSFTVVSDGEITAVAPAHPAGAVHIAVATPGGASRHVAADRYSYVARPVVTAISPNSGPHRGGTVVTITGKYFTRASTVLFGGTAGTRVRFVSSTKLTVRSPAHAKGRVAVCVRTAGGTSSAVRAGRFTYK